MYPKSFTNAVPSSQPQISNGIFEMLLCILWELVSRERFFSDFLPFLLLSAHSYISLVKYLVHLVEECFISLLYFQSLKNKFYLFDLILYAYNSLHTYNKPITGNSTYLVLMSEYRQMVLGQLFRCHTNYFLFNVQSYSKCYQ